MSGVLTWMKQDFERVASTIPVLQQTSQRTFQARFSIILEAFLTGYNAALADRTLHIQAIQESLDNQYDPYYVGFAYEGLGMGLGARTLRYPSEISSLEHQFKRFSPRYMYQYYVGLGWWMHTRYGFRPKPYQQWLSRLDPLYGSIVFDGVGFRSGIWKLAIEGDRLLARFRQLGYEAERTCLQGLGRSIWFLGECNLLKALQLVESLPKSHQPDVCSGLGLAVGYTEFEDLKWMLSLQEWVPQELRISYQQGLAFGLYARKRQMNGFIHWIDCYADSISKPVHAYLDIVTRSYETMQQTDVPYTYSHWLDDVRSRLEAMNV
ncbi:DUF1702 family protein [Marinicrinis sediminis]|uniref:DUF1702 family protein n=1 Tax=Marinicrinis sediminis TaxID=1652465 RepID=A0ABW5RE69_9BACL